MKSKKRKTISSVKKYLKKGGNLKKYKKLFKNKQIRFLFTKISIIFESTISDEQLSNIEISLYYNPTQSHFVESLKRLSKTFDNKFLKLK
jgi:ribosomal protein S8